MIYTNESEYHRLIKDIRKKNWFQFLVVAVNTSLFRCFFHILFDGIHIAANRNQQNRFLMESLHSKLKIQTQPHRHCSIILYFSFHFHFLRASFFFFFTNTCSFFYWFYSSRAEKTRFQNSNEKHFFLSFFAIFEFALLKMTLPKNKRKKKNMYEQKREEKVNEREFQLICWCGCY